MRQRKYPEDFRLQVESGQVVKAALKLVGGPQAVGSSIALPASTWYKTQAGDSSSVVFRYCLALLGLHNAGAEGDVALIRIHAFVEAFIAELMSDLSDADLEELAELDLREDSEADLSTFRAARNGFSNPRELERMARERMEQVSVGKMVALHAQQRAKKLRRQRPMMATSAYGGG